jgi:predicted nucleic acid-binding Zn finger protein
MSTKEESNYPMAHRRVSDDSTVEVWLERVMVFTDGSEHHNTWVLIGTECMAGHHSGMFRITSKLFRNQLAYVDSMQKIHMDETGDPIPPTVPFGMFRIGVIRLGAYTLDMNRRHCSCKSYQYLKTEKGDRNCKHLNSLCRPSYAVVYTKQKKAFQLISESVPKNASVYMDWIYSQKHDGIRVRVEGTSGWTRGGMKIDLSGVWTPPPGGYTYDAELCGTGSDPGNHDTVLARDLSGKLETLRLMIFDLIDPTDTMTCGQRLLRLWNLPIPSENLVRYQMVHVWRGTPFHTRLAKLDIGSPRCEGVIVRNPGTRYDDSGSRNNRSIFKVKHRQWAGMQQRVDHVHWI